MYPDQNKGAMMTTYDFDTVLSRKGTDSLKWDKYRNTEVLPFWVADMDFAVAPEIMQVLKDRLDHPIFGYTKASDQLVESLINSLDQQYGWTVHPDWLHWLPGVVTGLAASCRAYLAPGDSVMTNPPIYHHFFQAHNADENTLIQVPLKREDDRWTWDLDSMEAAIKPDTRLLLLCSPHNPTGTVFTRDEVMSVCELARKHNILIVSDEIHCGLILDAQSSHYPTASVSDYSDSVITLMSQSKTWNLAGMNCSVAIISNPELRQRFVEACAEIVPMVSTMSYVSAEAAFRHGEPWRQALLKYLKENYLWLREQLDLIDGLEVQRCDATYLAWIDATGLGVTNVQEFFEQHGVGMSAGEQFGSPGFVRLNFACPRATLDEGISRIRQAVASLA